MVHTCLSSIIFSCNLDFLLMRITKVTTKAGDKGKTNLGDGSLVSKSNERICSIGSIDNLNSYIGWASVIATQDLLKDLMEIQQDLFNLGGELSLPLETMSLLKIDRLKWLETEIQKINSNLPELKEFIIPRGSELCTRIHIIRTECRNAERDLVKLYEIESGPILHIKYLNRLSDYFFVLARKIQFEVNNNEIHWDHKK